MFARCSERNHNLKPMTHASFYPRESGGAAGGIPNWMTAFCGQFACFFLQVSLVLSCPYIPGFHKTLRLIEQRRN